LVGLEPIVTNRDPAIVRRAAARLSQRAGITLVRRAKRSRRARAPFGGKLAIVSRLAKCIVLGQRDFSACGPADG
jgi:hypothetical protein